MGFLRYRIRVVLINYCNRINLVIYNHTRLYPFTYNSLKLNTIIPKSI